MTDDLTPEERALRDQGLATGEPNLLGKYEQYLRKQNETENAPSETEQ